jgi:hypothetical protein
MTLRLVIASLFLAGTAFAQAPGEYYAAPGMTPPQPAADPCACGGGESAMARRFSIGLAVGSLSLAPESDPNAAEQFGIAQLAVRWRATLHIELELSLAGGQQQLADGSQGSLKVGSGTIAARYRFNPEQRWNWWLMIGAGGTTVAYDGATQAELDAAQRPHGMLGIGLERRFHVFALQAEARAIAVGDNSSSGDTIMPTKGSIGTIAPASSGKQSGGSLTLGLSYYF